MLHDNIFTLRGWSEKQVKAIGSLLSVCLSVCLSFYKREFMIKEQLMFIECYVLNMNRGNKPTV